MVTYGFRNNAEGEGMSKEKQIARYKEELGFKEVGPDQFTVKFLSKRLWQYRKIRLGKTPEEDMLFALADVYRNLRNFKSELRDTMVALGQEMGSQMKEGENEKVIYFPNFEQKLEISRICYNDLLTEEPVEEFLTFLRPMNDPKDWKRALEQERKRKK